jgi:hypothetical protein
MGGVLANWSNFCAELFRNKKKAAKNKKYFFMVYNLNYCTTDLNKIIIILVINKGFSAIEKPGILKNP